MYLHVHIYFDSKPKDELHINKTESFINFKNENNISFDPKNVLQPLQNPDV